MSASNHTLLVSAEITLTVHKLLRTLLAASLVVVGVAVPGSTASAAATCKLGTPTVTPSTLVVIGAAGALRRSLTVTATNCPPSAAGALYLFWVMDLPGDIGSDGWPRLKPTIVDNTVTFRATLSWGANNTFAGNRTTNVWGASHQPHPAPTLQLRRAVRVTTNATPEPIKEGRTITVRGRLTRANWDTKAYAGYAHQYAQLQFRTPTGAWGTVVRSDKADAHGYLRTTVTATRDGCYRWSFKGTSTTGSGASVGDCIDVK